MHIARLTKYLAVLTIISSSVAVAQNKQVDITAEFIVQMNYKVSRLMDCDWDPSRTMIFGYYGTLPESRRVNQPALNPAQQAQDLKSQLSQYELIMPTREELGLEVGEPLPAPSRSAFGINLNLEFTPAMMERDGMPLYLVEVDYKPLNKRCESGFGPGMMTR